MTTEKEYELIKAGKFKELELINKIKYWQGKKNYAQFRIIELNKKLGEIREK